MNIEEHLFTVLFVLLLDSKRELLPACVVDYQREDEDSSFFDKEDETEIRSNDDNDVESSTNKEEGKTPSVHDEEGLSVTTSIFFVVGDVIGAGVVALPYAMKLVSWFGLPLFIACSSLMCYCAVLLAKSCAKVMKNIDRSTLRDPYPRLGLEAAGKGGKYITTFSLAVNQILTCIVFILLAGEIFLELFPSSPWDHYSYRLQLRIWFCICGLFLLPFTYLGTPKDFKGIGFLAMATSGLAVVMIALMLGYLAPYPVDNDKTLKITIDGFMHSFGTVLFGFGGVSIFPTIQNDMKDPEKFVSSVCIGYLIVSSVYVVLPLAAYVILGDLIREDLLTTLSYLELFFTNHLFRTFCMVAQACICGHVLCAFVLNVNPVYQQFEGFLGIPTSKLFSSFVSMFSFFYCLINFHFILNHRIDFHPRKHTYIHTLFFAYCAIRH